MCAKELGSCNIASPHKAEYPNQSESSTKIQKTSKNVSAIVKFKEAQENRSKYQKVETANPVERLNTGAVQKAQVKNIGQYLLIQFGRVVYNADKLTYKVTLPEINNFLDKNLKLEAWIEHTGKRINSGHYVTIRRKGDTFIKMSDDHFSINKNNSIQKSKLCYIALLKPF